jgi:hypothetical protein
MEDVKFELELQSSESQTEILEFYEFLKGEIPGLQMQLKENPDAKKGAMSVELLPILQMALSSTVIAAGVNGIFSQIKDYFDLRRQKEKPKSDISNKNDNSDNNSKIVITREAKDGTKETISMNLFSEQDRKQFFEFLSK